MKPAQKYHGEINWLTVKEANKLGVFGPYKFKVTRLGKVRPPEFPDVPNGMTDPVPKKKKRRKK